METLPEMSGNQGVQGTLHFGNNAAGGKHDSTDEIVALKLRALTRSVADSSTAPHLTGSVKS